MCTTIHLAGRRDIIATVDDLAALVGIGMIRIEDGYHSDDPKDFLGGCLCPVNIPDTLIDAGFKVWADENDTMRYKCERHPSYGRIDTYTDGAVEKSATSE